MELIASDFDPPIIVGAGELRCPTSQTFEYTLTGMPADPAYALLQVRKHESDPYDGLLRCRLLVEDDEGRSYNAGWTIPKVRFSAEGEGAWTLHGECQGLMTDDPSAPSSVSGATEVEFLIPRNHRVALLLRRFVSTTLAEGGREPIYRLSVLGEQVTFRFDPDRDVLSISTPGGGVLPLTYAENWLGEPLRILFGQLAFPRLVARAFPNGGAMIAQRPSPAWSKDSDWGALWDLDNLTDRDAFWTLYGQLLSYIANDRDSEGRPNWEANTITRLYEEVIQASHGSRWVWALTFASSIEGLVRLLTPRGTARPDAHTAGIASLVAHIGQWPASTAAEKHLRGVAVSAVHRTAETTPKYVLDQLEIRGVVSKEQIKAWGKVRNAVMHGSLVSPYSSREDDELLLHLAALMKGLTREVVRPNRLPADSLGQSQP